MKNIAFVYTAYQQNIVHALCLQKKIVIDVLFAREGIVLHDNACFNKIIRFENLPYTIKNIITYYRILFRSVVLPEIYGCKINLFSWTLAHPLVSFVISNNRTKVNIIEDGSGTYLLLKNDFNLYKTKYILPLLTDVFRANYYFYKRKEITCWSLYHGCYPSEKYYNKLIYSQYFKKAIEMVANLPDVKKIVLDENAIVYITSPYVEFGLMSKKDYVSSIIEAISILLIEHHTFTKIYWKLHPSTNRNNEIKILDIVTEETGVKFTIIDSKENIEMIALHNKGKNICYYSFASTSLYVIKSLNLLNTKVGLIKSSILEKKQEYYLQLIQFYKKIGIDII